MGMHLVMMGVSGCGKSTVAAALATELGWQFLEGDDLHSATNIAKMRAGAPLQDADRGPWLDAITAWTTAHDHEGRDTVVACSALRRTYRDRLRSAAGRTAFCELQVRPATLKKRMAARQDHFMPPTLLSSQLQTLESLQPDEDGRIFAAGRPTLALVAEIAAWVRERR